MSELEETKYLVGLTKLQTIVVDLAESQKRTDQKLEQIAGAQLETDRKLRELVVTVRDLATIVASHERRLGLLEES